jgi:HEAT repeat protein
MHFRFSLKASLLVAIAGASVLLATCAASKSSGSASSATNRAAPQRSAPSANSETLRGYWALYKKDDPSWPAARDAWIALGEGDAWILVENLLSEIVRASDQGDARALSRARREMAEIPGAAVSFLVEALEHGDNVTRRHCGDALVAIGGEAVPALVGRLPVYDAPAKRTAADALARIGDARAIPALASLAREDADWAVRAAAVAGLALFLPSGEAEAAIARPLSSDPDSFIRRRAAESLANGHETVGGTALVLALEDGVPDVRAAAAGSLGVRGEAASSVAPLIDALERESERERGDASVRRAIQGALRELTGADGGTDAASWRRALREKNPEGRR